MARRGGGPSVRRVLGGGLTRLGGFGGLFPCVVGFSVAWGRVRAGTSVRRRKYTRAKNQRTGTRNFVLSVVVLLFGVALVDILRSFFPSLARFACERSFLATEYLPVLWLSRCPGAPSLFHTHHRAALSCMHVLSPTDYLLPYQELRSQRRRLGPLSCPQAPT